MSHRKHPHEHGAGPPSGSQADGGERGAPPPAPAKPEAAPAPAPKPPPGEPLAAKTRECQELVDRLQRLGAEYYNYQKRIARQMDEAERHACQKLVLDLLPAVDNFERALETATTEADFKALREGVQLVHDQLLAALARHGVTQVPAHGEEFDPEHHEAVTVVPSDEVPQGRVVEVLQKGYRLHGQMIRPSRVAVSGGPPKPDGESV